MDRSQHQNKRSHHSVDGMLELRRDRAMLPRQERPEPSQDSARPFSQGRLDNFRATDGFHPSKQPVMTGSNPFDRARQPQRDIHGVIDLSLTPAPPKAKKRRSWKRRIFRSSAAFIAFLVLVGGFLFAKGYIKLGKIFKGGGGAAALEENVDPAKLRGEGDGRVNILVLGKGGEGHEAPDLTDTILIASIDPLQKQAALLSIPRDLYEPSTSNRKINSIYAEAKYAALARKASKNDAEAAGLKAIEETVSDDMGIPIHYHVMIDFDGFKKAITTVGGVDLNVDKNGTVYEVLWDPTVHKNYTLDVKEGMQHFDGQRALFYARSRETSPRGDFDRAERQRKIMVALKDKVLSIGTFANPLKLSQLISDFGDHIQTNISKNEALRLYDIGKDLPSDKIASISLVDPPNNFLTGVNVGGQATQQPRAGATNFSDIQAFVRNALKDGFIANENATVAVFNGTETPGLAAKKAAELKSYGYNVTVVADTPTKTYQSNVLVDIRGQKKYTRHYLEQRLNTTATTSLPTGIINNTDADFVIILGQP